MMDMLISQAIIGELIFSDGFLYQSMKEKKKNIGVVMWNIILKYEHKYKEYFLHDMTDIILLKIRQIKKNTSF